MTGFKIDEDNYLKHYGIQRRSGRYPWGSGSETAEGRSRDFLAMVADLRKQGFDDAKICESFSTEEHPFNSTMLRQTTTIARNQVRASNIAMAQRLQNKGYSNGEIAKRMGLAGESSVRALLDPVAKERTEKLKHLADNLKEEVAEKGYIDVGIGVERYTGSARVQFDTALAMLKDEGYEVVNFQVDQAGTSAGNKTTYKVLSPPGMTRKEHYIELSRNPELIKTLGRYSEDGVKFAKTTAPLSLDSSRIAINYSKKNAKGEEIGGALADGTMYIRPGAKDLDMGGAQYAQVRIAVDGTHYLKGMAVYKNDLPDGVDLVFNTNKTDSGNKLDALKPLNMKPKVDASGKTVRDADGNIQYTNKIDIDNPFGASIKPGGKRGHLNIVNEEGDWEDWSKNLASQMLSKQKPTLAREQLDKTYVEKRKDLDEILSLTNPAVKKKLLEAYADGADSSAVHLKAAALPRQATKVLIPVPKMKDTEVYAPTLKDGERVALVRFPHGGVFEIPELTVNNRQPDAIKLMGKSAKDAIGINAKVAERLSGADFDGDAVLVIPNSSGKIKSKPPLQELKDFNPREMYKAYEGMPKMSPKQKQTEMGKVSNLITDMTIKGANDHEIARAVRHSMVVIDAEKHNLNYKASALDNNIKQLKAKYQGGASNGSTTIISRTTREVRIPYRKQGYKIDPLTGEKIYTYTGESYIDKKGKVIPRITKSQEGAEVKDARLLTSAYDTKGNKVGIDTPIERIYADHANRLKGLGNEARMVYANTKAIPYSPSAKQVYAPQVAKLNAQLNIALRNAPVERQAQILANAIVKQKRDANPDMDNDELKKIKGRALDEARTRTGAKKNLVDIDDDAWEAIQAGAITNHMLEQVLRNANLDRVKELATPRTPTVMTSTKQARARQLLSSGRTPSEVAQILGVAVSTLNSSMKEE